jgi:penicillin-binding protein 2
VEGTAENAQPPQPIQSDAASPAPEPAGEAPPPPVAAPASAPAPVKPAGQP